MTTPTATSPPGSVTSTSPASLSLTRRQVWTRIRGLLLALLLLVGAGIALAAFHSGAQHGRLDPRSADQHGSRAVAQLLEDRGVSVRVVTTLDEAGAAAGSDTTLLVTSPDLLTPHQQGELRAATAGSAGRTVLLSAGPTSVGRLAPGVRAVSPGPVSARAPRCSLAAARGAGNADTGGFRYISDGLDSIACYPAEGLPTLLLIREQGAGDTALLGSADFLYNDRLDSWGNASLALQLLGSRPHLIWYLPSFDDPSAARDGEAGGPGTGNDRSFADLIPPGWLWGTLQLFVAAVLAAVWRARRLGPLVTEQLPVAIRASESTEGRARLYRRANARDRAASSLRSATRTRVAPLVGVSLRDAHVSSVLLPAVATHLNTTDGSPGTLLFGPAPADDAALVRLADQLDILEREVRTS
ncbi:DUF4350 domain-containing protein [Streptomyces sp. NPDC058231]|uniref:DUF4350 domain-containing protein n=1 Tax=Streptomyces sp. NPDC058231 TaxID=3346392 RepID=UPI0036E16CB0